MQVVSTIIPTRNRAELLKQAIESVIAQNVEGSEIIVADDSSTDHTEELARSFPQVTYIKVVSGKPSRTRNAAIRAARGKYLAFLDDDDVWLPDRLAPALARLEAEPELGMVYGQAVMAEHDLSERLYTFPPLPLPEGHPVAAFLDVVIHLDTVLVRRDVLDDIGLLDESVYGAEDMDLTVRIARKYKVGALQQPLALVRVRKSDAQSSVAGATERWRGRFRDEFGLLRKHYALRDRFRPSARSRFGTLLRRKGWYVHMLLTSAQQAIDSGDPAEARDALAFALRISPLHTLRSPKYFKLLAAARAARSGWHKHSP